MEVEGVMARVWWRGGKGATQGGEGRGAAATEGEREG